MDGKIVQLELELEEMQCRVSKLEEFCTNLAKYGLNFQTMNFQILNKESYNENENSHREINTDDFAPVDPEVSNQQQLPEDDELDEVEFAFKIDVSDDEDNDNFKIEFEDSTLAGSSQDPFQLSDSSTEAHGEPVKKRPKTEFASIFHKIHSSDVETRPCPICKKTFKHKKSLGGHLRVAHKSEISISKPRVLKKPTEKKINQKNNWYQCYFCSRIYTDPANFQRHVRLHTGEHPYRCSKCQFTCFLKQSFKSHRHFNILAKSQKTWRETKHPHKCPYCIHSTDKQRNLERHIRLIHPNGGPCTVFNCYFCQQRFHNYHDFHRHFVIHTTERRYKCGRCHFTTGYFRNLKLHKETRHDLNSLHESYKPKSESDEKLQYKCPHCSYKTTGLSGPRRTFDCLENHIASHHATEESKQFGSKICKKKFGLPKLLWNHMKTHRKRSETTFLCHHCPFVTRKQASLNSHIRIIHEEIKEEDYFKCYFCQRKMNYLNNLTNHLRTHTGECPYSCDLCPHRTSDNGQLTKHKKNVHHAALTGRDFKCSKCQSAFKTQGGLDFHAKFHTKNAFKCSLCPNLQTFLSGSLLRQHFLKEHPKGGLNYACPHCPKKFKHHDKLEMHVNSHTGAKPFKCEKCIYATNRKGNLAKHVKICKGSKEKGADCDQCGQTFTNEGNVKRHKSKWHPKDEILNCQYCNHIFRDKDNLQTHLEKRHADKM